MRQVPIRTDGALPPRLRGPATLQYSTDDHRGGPPAMSRKTQKPAPDNNTTSLYRFCLAHGLSLGPQERCAEGVALSKVARERELPLVRVRERIEDRWIQSRVYPVWFLDEWLTRYTEAKATGVTRAAAEGLSGPQPTAANG